MYKHYQQTLLKVIYGTAVYCDLYYILLSTTTNFTSYNNNYTIKDQKS
ncbi:hypothetical protein [Candidatus Fukatsuia anoeciicola]